jgi:TDG/mug DNA glycosylase family protein
VVTAASSGVSDLLAPGLRCVFCGINPGLRSAAEGLAYAHPRNDFWRLLYEAGFTPRRLEPAEQAELLALGYGLTNAASRPTPGSGDLRRGDFDREGFARRIGAVAPIAVAFVGKDAYRGAIGGSADLGAQLRALGSSALFVLPSTSPANAAVRYPERLRWFSELHRWLEPSPRQGVRALIVDQAGRLLLQRFVNPAGGDPIWITPGGGVDGAESDREALGRELWEECGLTVGELGPVVFGREHVYPWDRVLWRQSERFYLLRVDEIALAPQVDLLAEGITAQRWWSEAELAAASERIEPGLLRGGLAALLAAGRGDTVAALKQG